MRIVTKAFLKYLPRRRALSILQLFGIACGVAAAVGMNLSSKTALSSFSNAVEFLRGRATHTIERPAGPMDEKILTRLMRDSAVEIFSPIIDRKIFLQSGETVRFIGLDPFLDRKIRPDFAASPSENQDMENSESFFQNERAVYIDSRLKDKLKLKPGDEIETSRGLLKVVGSFSNPAGEQIILMDIAHAQKFFDLKGKVDRVDLILLDEADFRSRWAQGFMIQSSTQRRAALGGMLEAFRLNLEALSLLALFVGVFLVYNTAMFAVVSRRRDAGILRGLGASRLEIIVAFLIEILFLGVLGGVLGGIGGYFLSRFLTGLMGETISSLYFFLNPLPLPWSWSIILFGILFGFGASLLGGLFPLIELVRTDPVKVIHGRVISRKEGTKNLFMAFLGILFFLLGLILFTTTSIHVYLGFAGAFCLLMGGSLATGFLLIILSPALKRILGLGGLPGTIAARNIRQNLGRTAVAVAAFMVALSMTVGLGSMIGSFRQSLSWWMESQLKGELYVAPTADAEVPPGLFKEIRDIKGIGGIDIYRNVRIIYKDKPVRLSAVNATVLQKYTKFAWLKGGDENWDFIKKGDVAVSESFYRRFDLGVNDTITLEAIEGPATFRIAAIFYDYTTEHGLVMMDRTTFLRVFNDETIDSLAIFVDRENPRRLEILKKVKAKAEKRGIGVISQSELKKNILTVFDTTFAVTRSMRIIAVIVAFFGIAGALLTLFMERQREFGIYRALGFSTKEVARLTLMEGLGMGIMSFFMCIVMGTALAIALIKVINYHSFNWTIFYYPALKPYVVAGGTAVLASIGAAAYPIWRITRTYPQIQIREE